MIKKEIGMDILYSDIFIFFSQKKNITGRKLQTKQICVESNLSVRHGKRICCSLIHIAY